ncbi:MAG: double-strand break repair protein AddB [Hyphomicrobiaceae bacterium]
MTADRPTTTEPRRPRANSVFTVSPGVSFLDALAHAVLAGDLPRAGGAPPSLIDLASITILLPTRRAARALTEAFLRASGQNAIIAPSIRPIAETDEDLALLAGVDGTGFTSDAAESLALPPAVDALERVLVLTQLVQRWSSAMRSGSEDAEATAEVVAAGARTPAQAAALATDLARLMDMIETEGVSLDRLEALVPEAFSSHWQQTLDFLKIVVDWWPAHLEATGRLSPAGRRNRLILAEARRIAANPPPGPLIVAGVTGSIPATAELMRVVAGLDNGAIVLPGLDLDLDDESFVAVRAAHPEHPQHGLARLLEQLGVTRADVAPLVGVAPAPRLAARCRLVSEAMRPASTTDRWPHYFSAADRTATAAATEAVAFIAAPTAQDEAEVVALILRETLETPGRTAALISPDRLLARRVAARLSTWGITVDDSAGRPFAKTPPGTFLELVVDAVAHGFEPVRLMALLKHPLTRLGESPRDIRRAARHLEIAALRGPWLGGGLAGIARTLDRARADRDSDGIGQLSRAARRLWDDDWDTAARLVARLEQATLPLVALHADRDRAYPLAILARAHIAVAEALAALPEDGDGSRGLWSEEAGETGARIFARLMDETLSAPELSAHDYADFYRVMIAAETVRVRVPVHPRLAIWGPFESRLQRPDVVVLGGLNDGVWPEIADPGPWLNRPMRATLGLPQPEERIGFAAHDMTQLMGAERVYLTRSQKVDGNPAVASRWLLRLHAVLAGLGLEDALAPDRQWLAWARGRDRIARRIEIPPPAPRPSLALRPRRLSVSAIETWIANPYALYARFILGLEALPALGEHPDASLRGSILHAALGRFAEAYPRALPDRVAERLVAEAGRQMAEHAGNPVVAAFWAPRFGRFAEWFAETEAARRGAGFRETRAEVAGRLVLDETDGLAMPFTLTARADRIDIAADGLVITDYKTASDMAPLARRARTLAAPQLPLEAAMALAGAFDGVAPLSVRALCYISASGGEPPGAEQTVKVDDIEALARTARAELARLVRHFDDEATPYRALRRAGFSYDYDDYALLARVAEWSGGEDPATCSDLADAGSGANDGGAS